MPSVAVTHIHTGQLSGPGTGPYIVFTVTPPHGVVPGTPFTVAGTSAVDFNQFYEFAESVTETTIAYHYTLGEFFETEYDVTGTLTWEVGTVDKILILQNIQDTLEDITIANGYRTDVVTVEPVWRVWGNVHTRQMPWLGYGVVETRPDPYAPGNEVYPKMSLSIVAHINESSPTAAVTAAANLEDDLIHAMCSPNMAQRGSDDNGINAIDTIWTRTQDTFPDESIEADGGLCMVMDFEIRWRRTTSRTP